MKSTDQKFRAAIDEHRFGRIFIAKNVYDDMPDLVVEILNYVLIVKQEYNFHRDAYELIGYSPDFRSNPNPGTEPPIYDAIIKRTALEGDDFELCFEGFK